MSRLDDLNEMKRNLDSQSQEIEERAKEAEEERKTAESKADKARRDKEALDDAMKKYQEVEKMYQEAEEKYQEVAKMSSNIGMNNTSSGDIPKQKKNNSNVMWPKVTALVVAGSILTGSVVYALTKGSLTGKVANVMPITSVDDTNDKDSYTVFDNEYEPLTDEQFEDLCAERIKFFKERELAVNEIDMITYLTVINSDRMAEDNLNLLESIVNERAKLTGSVPSDEEFINDTGKVCADTAMKNFSIFKSEHSSENFIRVSDSVFGEQKELVILLEEYVDNIVSSYGDNDKVNTYVEGMFEEMNSGKASKMDDGVGFAMSTYLILIDAMDIEGHINLNDGNRNMLDQLITSEKYVSDIKVILGGAGCALNDDVKTKTR